MWTCVCCLREYGGPSVYSSPRGKWCGPCKDNCPSQSISNFKSPNPGCRFYNQTISDTEFEEYRAELLARMRQESR